MSNLFNRVDTNISNPKSTLMLDPPHQPSLAILNQDIITVAI